MKTIIRTFALALGIVLVAVLLLWTYIQWENHRVYQFASENLDRVYHTDVRIVSVSLYHTQQYIWWIEFPFVQQGWGVEFVNPNYNNNQYADVTRTADRKLMFSFPQVIGGDFKHNR